MYEIIDKLLLFLCCLTLHLFEVNNSFYIIPVIIAVILSSLFVYYEDLRLRMAGCILYALLCLPFSWYIIFLPLVFYDILHTSRQYLLLLFPLLLLFHQGSYSAITLSFTVMTLLIAYTLKYKTDKLNSIRREFNELRDNSAAMSLLLEEKNQSLLKNQDYEIHLATLNERNRISRELHDSIGHLLSRALLQVGALLTVAKEGLLQEGLKDLKVSLSGGMDQIRSSIHNMYDESIDLYSQVNHLVQEFCFCPIQFEYDVHLQPPLQIKHSMIAVLKEGLANIMRHSNATRVLLIIREHPAMYQLVLQDNGYRKPGRENSPADPLASSEPGEGMGLRNIRDRVKGMGGNLNITAEDGFKIFITIPKSSTDKTAKIL
jgi:signal transduction histidine kinase